MAIYLKSSAFCSQNTYMQVYAFLKPQVWCLSAYIVENPEIVITDNHQTFITNGFYCFGRQTSSLNVLLKNGGRYKEQSFGGLRV